MMTHLNTGLITPTRIGLGLLPITIAGLFFFVIWESSGITFSPSVGKVPEVESLIYERVEQRAAGRSSLIGQLTWFVAAAIGFYLHLLRKDRALSTWARAWPLVILVTLIAMSVLWSSVPDIALRRIGKHLLLVAALAGIVVGARSPRQLLRLALVFTGIMMAMNCASVALFPGVTIDTNGDILGLFRHKNHAGQFTMVTVMLWFLAARWSRGGWMRAALWLGTLLWFLFLLGTDSRTSILAAVGSIICMIPIVYSIRWPRAGIIISLFALLTMFGVLFVLILLNVSFSDIVDFLEGERATFSSRTVVWSIAYKAFLHHTLLGTGYGSLWATGEITPAEQYTDLPMTSFLIRLTQAHSGYFDILATLGLVGVVVFLTFIGNVIGQCVKGFASSSEPEDGAAISELTGTVLIGTLIYNLTQTTFVQEDILWVTMMLCYLVMCSYRSPDKADTSQSGE